jgi:nucleoside-triphosphatase
MEMKSEKFKKAVLAALNSENKILGTITLKPNPFCDEIKKRSDTKIFYLTRKNREIIKKEIIRLLESK